MIFLFTTTEKTYAYCEDIVICLQIYFGYSQKKSTELVNKFWVNHPKFDEDDYRLHENSYYWAVIIHLKTEGSYKPQWWKNSSLWPPHQDYLRRNYGSRFL